MMVWRARVGMWLAAGVIFCVTCGAQEKIAELQKRFDHETNPVHRARLLEKLGDAQFAETRRAFKTNDLVTVGIVLEKYRDDARVALEGLKKKHPDAERQPGGYRQLEIHVRRGIREVEEILLRVPEQYQPPLQIVREDLDRMDREMIGMLFRHPGDQPPPVAPASTPSPTPTPGPEEKP
jgi:hypothetical protein